MMIRTSNGDQVQAGVQVAAPYARVKQMRGPRAVRSSGAGVSGLALGGWVRALIGSAEQVSGGESSARFLHRWQRGLGLRERSRANVNARGLGGDRDLLAGSRVSARAFLLRRLDPDGQLDKTADADLLRVAELLKEDLLERSEDSLGL